MTPRAAPARPVKLYTPRLLALSAQLAQFPLTKPFQYQSEARSRACGSVLEIGLDCGSDGRIIRIGMQVTACAVGQSSAAVMAMAARGRPVADIAATYAAIGDWLGGDAAMPDWPDFDALEPALAHKGRHGALLLPWKGAASALQL